MLQAHHKVFSIVLRFPVILCTAGPYDKTVSLIVQRTRLLCTRRPSATAELIGSCSS
jgi:hypothetical protein